MAIRRHQRFDDDQTMDPGSADSRAAAVAAAIGEPARARMLFYLIDGRARTSTELSIVAGVTASTASVHLQRLKTLRLVKVFAQGKHRYYSLEDPDVAAALEALSVVAGSPRIGRVPRTPPRLRAARTCYDHMAGALGVAFHDRLMTLEWLSTTATSPNSYELTAAGVKGLTALGIDIAAVRARRRRFAFACLDWSERRPHLGGAVGAALLETALKRKWVTRDFESRALTLTDGGRRDLRDRFALELVSA